MIVIDDLRRKEAHMFNTVIITHTELLCGLTAPIVMAG